ncbi:MAG: acetyl-CoA carboxylase biotin carboxyl carrier protein [PVC group bacterium]
MDKNDLFELLRWFEKSTLSEIALERPDTKVVMKKGGAIAAGEAGASPPGGLHSSPPPAVPAAAPEEGTEVITAPMVGTFYRSPASDAPPFVEAGVKVTKGKPLCILEAMKVMNELVAEFDCEIIEILARNTSLVEYGTPLFRVRRDD